MQFRIAKMLNNLMIYMAVAIALMVAGGFYVMQAHPESVIFYFVICMLIMMVVMIAFKYIESTLDKRLVIKMALENKIALVNIESSAREIPMRDSGFRNYWLYKFEGTLYPQGGEGKPVIFYEKMSAETSEIPTGSIYVTYDEARPGRIFVIPTELLARMPDLKSTVEAYEKRGDVNLKYLYAYNKRGMEIKRYQDMVT